jgi:DUF1680 family protein
LANPTKPFSLESGKQIQSDRPDHLATPEFLAGDRRNSGHRIIGAFGARRNPVEVLSAGEQNHNWSDGDCYKWIEAAAAVYGVTGDPELDRTMDYWIDVIAKAQAPDGYISTQIFLPRPKELAHFGFNPSNIMGAAELYRTGMRSPSM